MAEQLDWGFPGCPAPPDWAPPDWPALTRRFGWLSRMAGVAQDPIHHAEGDVLTHTGMVAAALAGLADWRRLAPGDRAALFAAALLHDVAKPECTVLEAGGRISSRGHARKGELRARSILWQGDGFDPPPFARRERIAKLVRYHGLPLWFLERERPERELIAASQSISLAAVALLAEADVRGRLCGDQPALLDRIALFREYCQEWQCYDQPRAFASDHSRFRYFQRPHLDPSYHAYDDTGFEAVLMCGLPAAGKDTWVAEHFGDWPAISLDDLRRELKVAPADNQGAVVDLGQRRARELLRKGQRFVWNATNVTGSRRRQLIELFAAYGARVRIVYVEAPIDTILRRNAQRPEPVPSRVIFDMLARLEVPDLTEAQQVEWHVTGA